MEADGEEDLILLTYLIVTESLGGEDQIPNRLRMRRKILFIVVSHKQTCDRHFSLRSLKLKYLQK